MQENREILRQILVKTRELKASSLLVFDLDSTLFDVHPRVQRVIEDFANHPSMRTKFPEAVQMMVKAKTERRDWGLKAAVLRAGLGSASEEFHQELKSFWLEKFFSNSYLQYDVPYDGAVQYVQALWKTGAHIAYLTGRDIHRMGQGSVEVLKKWQLPIEVPRTELILKPEKGMDDAHFKTDWFSNIEPNKFQKIWFFENEPVNIHALRAKLPQIEVIFFDSTHSGKAEAPIDLPMIEHYLFDSETELDGKSSPPSKPEDS